MSLAPVTAVPTPATRDWMYESTYSRLEGQGEVLRATGVATNECWNIYNYYGQIWASALYTCDTGK